MAFIDKLRRMPLNWKVMVSWIAAYAVHTHLWRLPFLLLQLLYGTQAVITILIIANRVNTANTVQPEIKKHDIFDVRRDRERINREAVEASLQRRAEEAKLAVEKEDSISNPRAVDWRRVLSRRLITTISPTISPVARSLQPRVNLLRLRRSTGDDYVKITTIPSNRGMDSRDAAWGIFCAVSAGCTIANSVT